MLKFYNTMRFVFLFANEFAKALLDRSLYKLKYNE